MPNYHSQNIHYIQSPNKKSKRISRKEKKNAFILDQWCTLIKGGEINSHHHSNCIHYGSLPFSVVTVDQFSLVIILCPLIDLAPPPSQDYYTTINTFHSQIGALKSITRMTIASTVWRLLSFLGYTLFFLLYMYIYIFRHMLLIWLKCSTCLICFISSSFICLCLNLILTQSLASQCFAKFLTTQS